MPEVIFTGPAGRLEGRHHPAKQKNAPIAMILRPHPQFQEPFPSSCRCSSCWKRAAPGTTSFLS